MITAAVATTTMTTTTATAITTGNNNNNNNNNNNDNNTSNKTMKNGGDGTTTAIPSLSSSSSSSLLSKSSPWPFSCPHPQSPFVLSINCGNTRCRWALHKNLESKYLPTIFWTTTLPENPVGDDFALARFIPDQAWEQLVNGGGNTNTANDSNNSNNANNNQDNNSNPKKAPKTLAVLQKSLMQQPYASYLQIYIISTNELYYELIPKLFAKVPIRSIQLKMADFLPLQYTGYPTLGIDRCVNLYAANGLYGSDDDDDDDDDGAAASPVPGPTLVVDGGTALTWTTVTATSSSSSVMGVVGGGIAPGVGMRFRALHEGTGALPNITSVKLKSTLLTLNQPLPTFASDTEHAMMMSVLRELAISLRSLIRQWVQKVVDGEVVATTTTRRNAKSSNDDQLPMSNDDDNKNEDLCLHVVLTGGDAWILEKLLSPQCTEWIELEKDNVLPKQVSVLTVPHLAAYGIGRLLYQQSKQHQQQHQKADGDIKYKVFHLYQQVLGQRVVLRRGGHAVRGTIVNYKVSTTTTTTASFLSSSSSSTTLLTDDDTVQIHCDTGKAVEFKIFEVYDRLLQYATMGENYEQQQQQQQQLNAKKNAAKNAAEMLAVHVPAIKARLRAEAEAAAAKKRAEEEAAAAKKRAEEEAAAAKKRADEEAAAAKKRADEEAAAAKKKEDEEAAAAKKKEDEVAAKKLPDKVAETAAAAAKKRVAEDAAAAAKKKRVEEDEGATSINNAEDTATAKRKRAEEVEGATAKKKRDEGDEAANQNTETAAAKSPLEEKRQPTGSTPKKQRGESNNPAAFTKHKALRQGKELVGRRIAKNFDIGNGPEVFFGTVNSYDSSHNWWHITFDDGDEEDLDSSEMVEALNLYEKSKANDTSAKPGKE